jgi:hypothetical protein
VFACEMAAARGQDIDQPRNLAKSVTVEVSADRLRFTPIRDVGGVVVAATRS